MQGTKGEFIAGAKTIDTSAEQLTVAGLRAVAYVLVAAAGTNADTVYVGHNGGVTAENGFPLEAGESVEIPVDDASKIWVIGGDTGQVVKYLIV